MKIESFEPAAANYETITTIHNALWPDDPRTAEEIKKTDISLDRNYLFRRDMIGEKGEIVAYGECGQSPWAYHPRKFWFRLQVHPEHEGRTGQIGRFYLEFLLRELAQRRPLALTTWTREDKTATIRFLESEGFQIMMRSPYSELELGTFEATGFQGVLTRVEASGIRLVSLDAYRSVTRDWQRRIYELHMETRRDTPEYDSSAAPTFQAYVERIFESQEPLAQAWHMALVGERLVGITMLFKNPARPQMLRTGFTGVRRSHRRRGIATALKVKAIAAARSSGAETIRTANAEENPMYALNLRLGFQPLPAELTFRKELEAV